MKFLYEKLKAPPPPLAYTTTTTTTYTFDIPSHMPSHSPFLFLLPLFFFIPLPSPYIVDNVNTTIARAHHISIVSFHFHSIAPCLFVPVPGELGKTGER